jgi:hypothetical protein
LADSDVFVHTNKEYPAWGECVKDLKVSDPVKNYLQKKVILLFHNGGRTMSLFLFSLFSLSFQSLTFSIICDNIKGAICKVCSC